MAVVNMKKLSLVALKSDSDKLFEELMWTGSVEVTDAAKEQQDAELPAVSPFAGELSDTLTEISYLESALTELKAYESAPKGLFSKKRKYGKTEYDNSASLLGEAHVIAQDAENGAKMLREAQAELNKLRSDVKALEPWAAYDLPLDITGSEKTDVILAVLPGTREFSELKERMDSVTEKYDVQVVHSDDSARYLFITVSRDCADELIRCSLDIGLAKQDLSRFGSLTPAEASNAISERIKDLEKRSDELVNELKETAKSFEKLEFACDVLYARATKLEAMNKLICTDRAVIMTAWVPETALEKVTKQLSGFNCAYEFTDPECSPEEIPVLLKNGPVTSNFESVVEMYSLPMYKTFDPTRIMSVFYFIIFGMMFGDFVYGLVLTVGGFLINKFLDLGKGAKSLINVFMICGVSSMIFGVLFGSYAGNLLGGIIKPIAFDIVEQPIYFLVLALAIGALHLLTAMGIRFYILCKEKKVFDAIVEIGSWYIIFAGIAIAVLLNKTAGIITAGVGAAIIVLFKEKTKNPIMRILKGLLGLYDIVNFASDLLSYSRIMALGMSSAIIAMVVNTLADLPGKSPVGIVLMVIILLLGHIVNIALNILGTFVHTSRLQYIEFFGKFYVDGGLRFRPMALAPKYTEIN